MIVASELYPPDGSINGRRLHALASTLAGQGVPVRVITGHPHYRTGRVEPGLRTNETVDGVVVTRLPTLGLGKKSVVRRGVTAILFSALAFWSILTHAGAVRLVVAMSPSLFTAAAAGVAARLRRARFLYDIEDMHPDVALEVGALRPGLVAAALRGLERFVFVLADRLVVISPGFRELLIARGIAADRIAFIPNWADPEFFDVPARETGGAGLTLIFVGTHGLAQDLETLVDLARALETSGARFVFVGDGVAKVRAEERAAGLTNVEFLPAEEHGLIPKRVSGADICLVALRGGPVLARTIPSKTYEYLASGRPVIAIAGGDVAELVDGGGRTLPPGSSVEAVAQAVLGLAVPSVRARVGEQARVIAEPYRRERVLVRYVAVIRTLLRLGTDEGIQA